MFEYVAILYGRFSCLLFLTAVLTLAQAKTFAAQQKIIVNLHGKGDYKSIQAAINSLPDSSATPRIIFIRNGIYNEKLYIQKHNIIFIGEDRDGVVITQAIARDEWRCQHNDDWGVATINIDGNDITLQNLTIVNSYGFDWKEDRQIDCKTDTLHSQKTITKYGHQMAMRTMKATRLRAINCHFKSFAGDTVSPWNVDAGMFYFKDCIMEGGVDFYCPRGWAYAENCRFITHTGDAAIWHDGSKHKDSKTVLVNCTFDGFAGFNLGRFHKDSQFYLINCTFSTNMADRDIYQASSSAGIQWGRRVYYYNCHRNGGDYAWFQNNLQAAEGSPKAADITAAWVFKDSWHPQVN